MVLPKILAKGKLSIAKGRPVEIEQLDAALDVPTARFERECKALAGRLRRAKADVNVAGYRDRKAVASRPTEVAPTVDGRGGFYQHELRRLPPMDRDEEFKMARRYEFLKLRVQRELEASGIEAKLARELAAKPRSVIEARVDLAARDAYLDRCVQQLEELRNLYVEGGLHIVLGTVARYRGLGVDALDLIQEGNASLFQAIEGFDWRRDVRFRTYAQYWVQQAVLKMLYNSARTVRIPVWVQKILGRIRRVQDEGRRAGRELTPAEIGERLGLTAERVSWVLATKRYAVSLDAERGGEEGIALINTLADESAVPVPESVPVGDLRKSLEAAMSDLSEREQVILRRRFGLGGAEPETLGDIAVDLGITAERVRQLQGAALQRLQKPAKLGRLAAFVE